MKILITLAVLVVAASAQYWGPHLWHGTHQVRTQDVAGNYAFGYHSPLGGSFRRESGDAAGNKAGSYGVRDADGKLRIVSYVADAGGFRANIQSEGEVDKDAKAPANVQLSKIGTAPLWGHPFGYII